MTVANKVIDFFTTLKEPENLPNGISVINPYKNDDVRNLINNFYNKYFNDSNSRVLILGINPGRFGGGVTGISFTDPIALRDFCSIKNPFGNKRELSSTFVYDVITKFGGCKKFYSAFFLSAVYPLAIINNGKNHNYYDSKNLFNLLEIEIIDSLKKQSEIVNSKIVISLGKKNADFISRINNKINLFKKIEYLEHPRFIMQYRRKKKNEYIEKYLSLFDKYS